MKYALLVAWREFAESAKAKGFWIGLFMMPAILFLSVQVPVWLEQKAAPVRYLVIVDQTGKLAPVVKTRLEFSYQQRVLFALKEYAHKYGGPQAKTLALELGDGSPWMVDAFMNKGGETAFLKKLAPLLRPAAPPFVEPRRLVQETKLPAEIDPASSLEKIADALRPYLIDEKRIGSDGQWVGLSAAVLIPKDIQSDLVRPGQKGSTSPSVNRQIQYWSVNASDFKLREEIEQAVNEEVRRTEFLARGLDGAAIQQVERTYAPIATLNPKKEKGKEAVGEADVIRQWAPSGFVYLLWLAIFVIIQMLLNNTIEEKSNRIIEVLLSSVTPGELMMGKLIGIAAVGLTMIGGWMAALFGILSWKSGGASEVAGQILVVLKASNLVPLFSLYFLLGYLLYAALILSIGSVCNTIKEAQSYMGVLTMVMMVPLLTMTFIPKDPNGPLARLLSWIPVYTPFTMMNRANADPPILDLIGTLVLLIACTATALWMCGKVFRIGILRTGQPPRVVEMLRWALRKQS
jgi:ABC-2 type transport system permease protein